MNKFTYAILNMNDICEGINTTYTVNEKINLAGNCIEIEDGFEAINRKYDKESNTWSEEKFEPKSTAPLDRLEELEKQNADLTFLLVEKGVL